VAASSCQSCPDGASFRPTGDLSHLSRPASLIGGQQANLEAFTESQWSVGAAETNDDVAAQVVADPSSSTCSGWGVAMISGGPSHCPRAPIP
jgi:hypothetical protein